MAEASEGRRQPAVVGLDVPFDETGRDKKRKVSKSMPIRCGPIWSTVSIIANDKAYTTAPEVVCIDCGKSFVGGVTRIKTHLMKQCSCSTSELQELRAKLVLESEQHEEEKVKMKRIREVDAAANKEDPEMKAKESTQRDMHNVWGTLTSEIVDNAVADFIYGCSLPANITESPQFASLLTTMKCAPSTYKLPTRERVLGDLLDKSKKRLRSDELPLREACTSYGCTVVSDGWDDVQTNHLINFLVATNHGAFFDGTVKLTSDDSEDATGVAKLISDEIERVGALNVIQVVTDTCSVMKSAWKIIEKNYPWITCTCCAPHVLSLLLKDIGKIPEVAEVLNNTRKVLNRFWGRKRWCRNNKLREVTLKNHGKPLGLYRAAVTRFAGKVREMGRMLRLKADLKYIVDLPAYSAQDYRQKKNDDGADDDLDGEGGIKDIILDEAGFWKPLVAALKIMTPVVTLLRMCDSDKPVIGKIYDRMFMLSNAAAKSDIPWAARAKKLIDERWEYLHSFMHGAGYALDPEFLSSRQDWDTAVANGIGELIERISLLDCIKASSNPEEARKTLTTSSAEVITRVADCELELSQFRDKEGVFSKQSVLINAKRMAPAKWWKQYGTHLPLLSSVAQKVLAQVVCSSAAERNWSIYGRIKTKGRSQLGHSRADKLVYCHEAIHLKNKLQRASYTQLCEKWDTDSDSDSDVEEADLMA